MESMMLPILAPHAKNTTWLKKGRISAKKGNSELPKESLEEFKKRNAVFEERRYSTSSSPYYKELTDFTLDINKEKVQINKEKSPAIEFYEANSDKFEKDVLSTDQSAQPSTIPGGNSRFRKVAKLFSGKNNLELNKESLDELNKRNAVLQEKGYTASSPYYKGLTDFTLDIHKEKIPTTGHESTPSHSKPDIFPPDQSSDSSATSKGSTWSQKATRFFTKKKSSDLTESSLEEFNRRNAILEEKRYFHISPYYVGLTDFTLDIKKEKVPVIEIHEAASVTSSTRSSFIVRMQQLGTFCFFFKNKVKKYVSSSSSSSQSRISKDRDSGKEVKSTLTKSNVAHLFNEGKPLRERDLPTDHAAPSQLQTSQTQLPPVPQVSQPAETSETKEMNPTEQSDTEGKRKPFTWADTYRPYTLTDFIGNRETATELKAAANSGDCCHFIFEGKPVKESVNYIQLPFYNSS
ncbi:uncharacterized protein LOC135148431 [Daucus carota subsp. sativus]|uniref:uncharacterized protein LOC135148431 n=1 Tax=Daucus carota subsp. sativus TaxID=79200 RepID=UPI003083A9FA